MRTVKISTTQIGQVNLAFDADKLESLLHEGKLHAADFQCLDPASKKSVWSMLLTSVATKLGNR